MVADAEKHKDRSRRKKILLRLLREARLRSGLRQADLAKRLGLPQSFVSKYESGERRLDLLELQDVCAALGSTESDFVAAFQQACAKADEVPKDRPDGP